LRRARGTNTPRGTLGNRNRAQQGASVGSRETIGDELLDLGLCLVGRCADQFVDVLGCQLRRQHHDGAEVQSAVGHSLEQSRELASSPSRVDPFAGCLFREMKLPDTVREHRGIGRRQKEPALIDLGEIGQQGGHVRPVSGNHRDELRQQQRVGEM